MLGSMRAIVTPQTVINNCIDAARATGLGRKNLLEDSRSQIDHFGYCVHSDDYADVSYGLQDMLERAYVQELPLGGEVTFGQQKLRGNRALSWYYGNPISGLAVTSADSLSLQAGGGFIAVYADLETSDYWLHRHNVQRLPIQLYGSDALWVPLSTPDYGVGSGYYALCVVSETLRETTFRLSVAK